MNLIIGIAAALGVLIVIFIISYLAKRFDIRLTKLCYTNTLSIAISCFSRRRKRGFLESGQETSLTSERPGSKRRDLGRASNIPGHQNLAFVLEPTETKKKNKLTK